MMLSTVTAMTMLAEVNTDDRAMRGVPERIRCAWARTFRVPGVWFGEQRGLVPAAHHAQRARRHAGGRRAAASSTAAASVAPHLLSGVRLQLHRRTNRHRNLPELRQRGGHRLGRARGGRLMARLKRFEDFRYIGDRVSMKVYDTDDAEQFSLLQQRVAEGDLYQKNLLQTFGPDEVAEARNRGFKPMTP
jgi:hypothetical protein